MASDEKPSFTFDDIYSENFSYSSFYPNWISSNSYISKDSEGIQVFNVIEETSQILVSNQFYVSSGAQSYSISEDQQYFLARTSYFKQWRHSYNGSYSVYRISDESLVFGPTEDTIQYIRWSPTGNGLLWVVENDIYYQKSISDSPNRLTFDGKQNTKYNGIPDWVYEEEMVFSKNNIFWSPNSRYIAYIVTSDIGVEQIEFSMFKDRVYPEMIKVAYPKAGTTNPTVELKIYDTLYDATISSDPPERFKTEEHLFSRFRWFPDSNFYLVYWLNRISNVTILQRCSIEGSEIITKLSCSVIQSGSEESSTGWVGDESGIPYMPILLSDTSIFYSILTNDNGFSNIVEISVEYDTKRFLTSGDIVITELVGLDEEFQILYFMAAYPLPRNRHLMRIKLTDKIEIKPDEWDCLTCEFDQERCSWVSADFSPEMMNLVINCGGPGVPISFMMSNAGDGEWTDPEIVIDNADLVQRKAEVKWPLKEYGSFVGTSGIEILYQMHKPSDFDPSKKYPLLIEVYGGPGFQKVQDRWTRSWAPIHMVSTYDIIVVSLDGRGSAFRGTDIMHSVYRKLGQYEKKDTSEVALHFANKQFIDEDRIAVWGWSYGGYTTTFTISEGNDLFKCGIAVAPLASRFYYDSIHTERFMSTPEDNEEGYRKCSILETELSNFNRAWYSIIHGTADDNVHFQNAALITKALIEADVNFDDFFYADEAHSINTGENAKRHIYQLLTQKVLRCFNIQFIKTASKQDDKSYNNNKI